MKKLILLPAVLLVSACAFTDYLPTISKPSCYERVAVSKLAIERGYTSTRELLQSDLINVEDAETSLIAFDNADAAVDAASTLCAIDDPAASDYLNAASEFMSRATEITQKED